MKYVGIVAEYNPFHTGHKHQIDETKRQLGQDSAVIVAMSGHWTQQADCAIANKWTRAHLAVLGGADLVVELPTVWAMSSAESFCRGAVTLLARTGLLTHLSFGSEGGEIASLRAVADCLDSDALQQEIQAGLSAGLSFPATRQLGVEKLLGERGALLARPNNTLGIEYLRALNALHSDVTPITITRRGADHNSIASDGEAPEFTSATDMRGKVAQGDWDYVASYLGAEGVALLRDGGKGISSIALCERAILAKIRAMTADDWAKLPDSGSAEGLPNRLEQAGRSATSVRGFYDCVKTKRYTHSRLRRLVMSAFLGISLVDRPAEPPYLRVLAFNHRGREILREMKKTAQIPVITKPSHVMELGDEARALFALESRCTDLYGLCLPEVAPAGLEWTTPAIYVGGAP